MQNINDLALKMQMQMFMVSKKNKRQEIEPLVKAHTKEHASTNDDRGQEDEMAKPLVAVSSL